MIPTNRGGETSGSLPAAPVTGSRGRTPMHRYRMPVYRRRTTPLLGRSTATVAALGLTALLAVSGCSGGGSASTGSQGGATGPSGSLSPTSTETIPVGAQWCATYTTVTKVLAQLGDKIEGAETALKALETFDQLWDVGDEVIGLSQAEVEANRRAVAAYVAVEKLIAQGAGPASAEVQAAKNALTASTEKDRELLASSAQKVVAACGGVTSTPSASAS